VVFLLLLLLLLVVVVLLLLVLLVRSVSQTLARVLVCLRWSRLEMSSSHSSWTAR
jgi:hypothetical protein